MCTFIEDFFSCVLLSNEFIHTRLEKLLMEQKFEEAFALAAKYGLDREVSEIACTNDSRVSRYRLPMMI